MSQWGARALAERGETYREILRTFYPGARLRSGGGAQTRPGGEREPHLPDALAFAERSAR